MIIVEGPDGAGKSTLVRKLREHFNLAEGKRGTNDRKLLYTVTVPDTMRALVGEVDGRQPALIWDRLYYSELVYADIVGRPVEFNATQQSFVQRLIDAIRCPVIVCMPPLDFVRDNAAKHEQMKGVNEKIEEIYSRYVDLLHHGAFPEHTIVYNYLDGDIGSVFAEVSDYLDERSVRSWAMPSLTRH